MAITPTFQAGGTGILTATFTDENGNSVTPNMVTWTLKQYGVVVNARENVSVSPAPEVDIVLSGDDLVGGGGQCLIVNATYDSDAGLGLPMCDWIEFNVKRSCGGE